MRGKVPARPCSRWDCRITPAYAGKSGGICAGLFLAGDHPRVCGEKKVYASFIRCQSGSPPRMRGKDAKLVLLYYPPRITPAYAGKSIPAARSAAGKSDHPRVCGEKPGKRPRSNRVGGSPPRMRGKASAAASVHWFAGITPAYAGKRPTPKQMALRIRDHPRVCGEKMGVLIWYRKSSGSPPRMRGKVASSSYMPPSAGITPAYAGKS